MRKVFQIFLFLFLLIESSSFSQGLLLNEIMINPNDACDGQCVPNTADWIELYNSNNSPLDISCYTLITKKFAVIFPVGSVIQPFSFFVLGSPNFGPVDLSWASTNVIDYPSSLQQGVLSNTSDFIALYDNNQIAIDGATWESSTLPTLPATPLTINGVNACGSVTINQLSIAQFPAGAQFTSNGGNGNTMARKCDGSSTWEVRSGVQISKGATNGVPPVINFTASDTTLCPNDCISFTDLTPVASNVTAWNWALIGTNNVSSNIQNPTGICYPFPGFYNVSLTVTNACGSFTKVKPFYLEVINAIPPIVNQANVVATCASLSLNLIAPPTYTSYQWLNNNVAIPGATNDTVTITQSGSYTLTVIDQGCAITTPSILINAPNVLNAQITPSGPTNFCIGDSVVLSSNTGFAFQYQWLLNNIAIAGATQSTFAAIITGSYAVVITDGSCIDTSNIILVNVSPSIIANISPPGIANICLGNSLNYSVTPSSGFNYQWILNGNNISSANSSNYIATSEGVYSVQVSDANGCTALVSATLNVDSVIVPTITSTDPSLSLCTVASMTLSVPNNYTSYQWLNNTTNLITGANANSLLVTVSDSYSLIVSANGCSDTTSIVFVSNGFNQPINITANGDTTFCQGGNVSLDAGAFTNVSYQWLEAGTVIAGQTSQTITVNSTGLYSVQVTDAAGCSGFSPPIIITVNVLPNILINASSSLTFCQGNSVTLSATAGAVGLLQWLDNSAAIIGATSSSLQVTNKGNYSLVFTDVNGCIDTSNVLITDTIIAFNITFQSSTGIFSFCPGGNINIIATPSGAATYNWTLGTIPLPTTTNTINVTQAGNYNVLITDVNGCTNVNSVNTSLYAPPVPVILPNNTISICSGQSIQLSTLNFASYVWTLNGMNIPTQTTQNLLTNQPGSYTVTVTDNNGCQATSSQKVINTAGLPTPQILTTSQTEVCEGFTRTILVDSSYVSYLWSTLETTQFITVTTSGYYKVKVTDANNCTNFDSVFVNFKPNPTLIMSNSIVLPCGEPDTLRAFSDGTVVWSPSTGLSNPNNYSTAIETTKESFYYATATLDGCKTTDSILVSLGKCDSLFIPSAFTPNDDGFNEEFKVSGKGIKQLKLEVFNRWGQLVFFTNDPDKGWDGTYNLTKCPEGIYTWQVEAFDYFQQRMLSRSRTGKISLIR